MTDIATLRTNYLAAADSLHSALLALHVATEAVNGSQLPTRSIHIPYFDGLPTEHGPFVLSHWGADGFLKVPQGVMSGLLATARQGG